MTVEKHHTTLQEAAECKEKVNTTCRGPRVSKGCGSNFSDRGKPTRSSQAAHPEQPPKRKDFAIHNVPARGLHVVSLSVSNCLFMHNLWHAHMTNWHPSIAIDQDWSPTRRSYITMRRTQEHTQLLLYLLNKVAAIGSQLSGHAQFILCLLLPPLSVQHNDGPQIEYVHDTLSDGMIKSLTKCP